MNLSDFFLNTVFAWVESPDNEGGGKLSLDPQDPGNWANGKLKGTKYGVAAASHPQVDIANLTYEGAAEIAYSDYWVPAHCYDMYPAIALCVFDFAYNAGTHEAIKVLQRALGVTVDGWYGQQTHDALWRQDRQSVIKAFTAARDAAYEQMAGFGRFGRGWEDRAARTEQKALSCLTP